MPVWQTGERIVLAATSQNINAKKGMRRHSLFCEIRSNCSHIAE